MPMTGDGAREASKINKYFTDDAFVFFGDLFVSDSGDRGRVQIRFAHFSTYFVATGQREQIEIETVWSGRPVNDAYV